ncbi:hypothetical protein EVAR_33586_1 [Eumeta japonica]|uniref:Uncharacterized protein n=1 Tax=Eumeta variegata TaxID=151549 RepID=A0A4C1VM23_EUMVA|nr:hypothetical protein EVAR_33586_1 [Eumeta japonica]
MNTHSYTSRTHAPTQNTLTNTHKHTQTHTRDTRARKHAQAHARTSARAHTHTRAQAYRHHSNSKRKKSVSPALAPRALLYVMFLPLHYSTPHPSPHFSLHQLTPPSIKCSILSQEAGNAMGTPLKLRMSMDVVDHLLMGLLSHDNKKEDVVPMLCNVVSVRRGYRRQLVTQDLYRAVNARVCRLHPRLRKHVNATQICCPNYSRVGLDVWLRFLCCVFCESTIHDRMNSSVTREWVPGGPPPPPTHSYATVFEHP